MDREVYPHLRPAREESEPIASPDEQRWDSHIVHFALRERHLHHHVPWAGRTAPLGSRLAVDDQCGESPESLRHTHFGDKRAVSTLDHGDLPGKVVGVQDVCRRAGSREGAGRVLGLTQARIQARTRAESWATDRVPARNRSGREDLERAHTPRPTHVDVVWAPIWRQELRGAIEPFASHAEVERVSADTAPPRIVHLEVARSLIKAVLPEDVVEDVGPVERVDDRCFNYVRAARVGVEGRSENEVWAAIRKVVGRRWPSERVVEIGDSVVATRVGPGRGGGGVPAERGRHRIVRLSDSRGRPAGRL